MKAKLDFVTNSSSTSVVLWGTYLNDSEVQANKVLMQKVNEYEKKEGREEFGEDDGLCEIGEALCEVSGLETRADYESNGIFIGKSPFSMKEDETLKEFKSKIESKFKEIGINKNVEQIVESWYDG